MISVALPLLLAVTGVSRETRVRVVETAMTSDTIGVLQAIARHTRTERGSADSARKAQCADGDRSHCPARYPHEPIWFIPTDSAGAAQHLARIDSVTARSDSRLPSCPWPAHAPAEAGYQARVDLRFEGEDHATVVVRLTCRNPSGYLHEVYKLDRTYEVVRSGTEWKAQLTRIRVT